jgi:hypothetical protein
MVLFAASRSSEPSKLMEIISLRMLFGAFNETQMRNLELCSVNALVVEPAKNAKAVARH